jgi:two-component system, chemotaxis family, chemotaxis protein CheY
MEVLIVDDSESVRIALRHRLEERGYIIYEAFDGLNALEVLQDTEQIKMIVTDLNMPGLNGLDFVEQARGFIKYKETPVLVYTTEVCDFLKERARDLGVMAWLVKPIPLDKMVKVVEKIFSKEKNA